MKPTPEQEKIILEKAHRVVLARPGSGKTFTLSKIIQEQLRCAPVYKGVIAISYTKKASKELEMRSVVEGMENNNSFFGTIDKFTLQEIVFPFFSHAFQLRLPDDSKVCYARDIQGQLKDHKAFNLACRNKGEPSKDFIDECVSLFKRGNIILEACPKLALYILNQSFACQNYFKARYTHIIVDEYQDSGWDQHALFMRLKEEGLIAIAVGDLDQSIYSFAGKDSSYLSNLASNSDFKTFDLPKNHRSHPSIVNYSLSFISANPQLLPCKETRVSFNNISGTQVDIVLWIEKCIASMEGKGYIRQRNEVGILVRGEVSALIVKDKITMPLKHFIQTEMDTDNRPWSLLFRDILLAIHSNGLSVFDFAGLYTNEEMEPRKFIKVLKLMRALRDKYQGGGRKGLTTDDFVKVADCILPEKRSAESIAMLGEVISDDDLFYSYREAQADEVQLLTLHKSKGLEFTVVFHLDLYNYIIPPLEALKGNEVEMEQSKNLHYVGITRAKEYCLLISSTQRLNRKGEIKVGITSDFITRKELESLRV